MLQYQSSKILVVPRGGLPRSRVINDLEFGGTLIRSTASLGFLPRVSHQRDIQLLCEDVAPSESSAACRQRAYQQRCVMDNACPPRRRANSRNAAGHRP